MGNQDTICCFGPRSWAKIIARIQIMLNTAGFILFTIVLTGLLELGQNGFNQAGIDGKQPEQVTNMTYYGCLAVLLISLGVFIIGAFFGLFLFKGAYESKTTYLKWWIVYAVLCSCWSMFYTIFDPDTLKIILMIISAVMYGFGVYVVRCLIQEILEDRKMRQDRISIKSRLLRTHQPLTYKYTLLNV